MNRLVLAALLACVPGIARAHALETSTARVALRDGHVEVVAEWDVFAALEAAPTDVAIAEDAALAAMQARLVTRLESESQLELDGAATGLKARGFPSRDELRALAATLSAAGQDHGTLVRFFLDAEGGHQDPARIAFRAPPVLGPVLVSFVQPVERYGRPGERATFTVLEVPREVDPKSLGVGFACGALLAGLIAWRRST